MWQHSLNGRGPHTESTESTESTELARAASAGGRDSRPGNGRVSGYVGMGAALGTFVGASGTVEERTRGRGPWQIFWGYPFGLRSARNPADRIT